jgi:hypothetical protein
MRYLELLGGIDGGEFVLSGNTTKTYDFIVIGVGVILTVLADANGVNLLTAKNLTGITFNEPITLASGSAGKIKNITYSGGNVFGFNL